MVASVALPATFDGTGFLVALWVVLGLTGVALVVSSEPVKKPLLAGLRKELGVGQGADGGEKERLALAQLKAQDEADTEGLRIALAQIEEELEYAESIIETMDHNFFYTTAGGIPMRRWDEHGATLAARDRSLHRAVREAYLRIDELNRNLDRVQYDYDSYREHINGDRANAALPPINKALKALEEAQP